MKKFYWFQISPTTPNSQDKDEERHRICTWLSTQISPYIFENPGHYRGQNTGELQDNLARFLKEPVLSPLAIVVSCHGQKGSGNFSDWNGGNKRFSWTPERLWNGYENFKGLKSLLKERENIKAYVVLAQCYGGIFGEKLKEIVTRERYEHIEVIGLSKETTQRVVSKKGSTVATTCYHKQLAHWLNTFSAIKLPEGSEEDLDIDTESGDE